ncbi:hypothetical protein BDFB_015242, partial [Asbolus verrucosus]
MVNGFTKLNHVSGNFVKNFPMWLYVVRLFRETGSIHRKSGSGRPTKRTPETVENVREIMQDNPHTSLRRLSQQVDLSYST